MPVYETTVTINAKVEAVWKLLSDVAVWHTWLPTVTSVEPLDGAPIKVGSRYALVQPKLQPATWTVTLVEPPHRFVWESRVPGMVTVGDHVFEELQPGTAKVTLSIKFSGLFGSLIGLMYGTLTKSYIEREAQTLKTMLENPSKQP